MRAYNQAAAIPADFPRTQLDWRELAVLVLRAIADEVDAMPHAGVSGSQLTNNPVNRAKLAVIAEFLSGMAEVYRVEDSWGLSAVIRASNPDTARELTLKFLEASNLKYSKGIEDSLVTNGFVTKLCSESILQAFLER